MDSDLFLHIMEGHLIAQANAFHENNWRLVMDNDPKHTSRKVKVWLSHNVPNQIPWPSQSPDLNPIEIYSDGLSRSIPELKSCK